MLIAQHELIHDHRTQGEQLRALQALNRAFHPALKDVLLQAQAVEGFDGLRAQLMKHFPDRDVAIPMGICATTKLWNEEHGTRIIIRQVKYGS